MAIKFEPLSRLIFKPPQPFEAGVHGPGSYGSTLSYPMPGTIAGALAEIAYSRGMCTELDRQDGVTTAYKDLECCLSKLLGDGFRIYTGLLEAGGRYYVYINSSVFPPLDEAANHPLKLGERIAKDLVKSPIKALRARLTGIALNRASKSVEEGMLYSLESIIYQPHASILAIARPGGSRVNGVVLKLGSKTGAVRVVADRLNSAKATRVSGEAMILLVSPAILDGNPLEGPLVLTSQETSKRLGKALLKEAGIKGEAEVIRVPKGEHELSTQTTGWSLLQGRPRPPMLVVPPGTLIRASLDNVDAVEVDGHRLVGLGCCSMLGWGTGVVVSTG